VKRGIASSVVSIATSLTLLGAWGAVGCGPSVQSIYEGDIRFEHCYRLDLDPNIAQSHREACWQEWVTSYTYGQTRDRTDYARRRLEQLRTRGDPGTKARVAPLDPQLGPLDPATSEAAATHVGAHRPPPTTAQSRPVSADGSAAEGSQEAPPSHECAASCREIWANCSPAEKLPGEIASESERAECNRAYSRCMRRCFEE
jgi:hypothetical protein